MKKSLSEKMVFETPLDCVLLTNELDEWTHIQGELLETLRDCEREKELFIYQDAVPLLSYFERSALALLATAGFDKMTLKDPKEFASILNFMKNESVLFNIPIFDRKSSDSKLWETFWPGNHFPEGTFKISENKRTFWLKPRIKAALSVLKGIASLRSMLSSNSAVAIYAQTLEMTINLLRTGLLPETVLHGVNFSETQSKKGGKPRTRNGMNPAQRRERNEAIRRHFQKSRLDVTRFSQKYQSKYGLKARQIRNILK
jgi:hypothetical protein